MRVLVTGVDGYFEPLLAQEIDVVKFDKGLYNSANHQGSLRLVEDVRVQSLAAPASGKNVYVNEEEGA